MGKNLLKYMAVLSACLWMAVFCLPEFVYAGEPAPPSSQKTNHEWNQPVTTIEEKMNDLNALTGPASGEKQTGAASIDFLMQNALKKVSSAKEAAEDAAVTRLQAENCQSTGYPENGATACKKSYANGSFTQAVSNYEMLGDELKQQTVMTDFDRNGNKTHSKTVRQKTDFTGDNKSGKAKEFIDIVDRPSDGRTTREILVFQYYGDGKTVQVALWAKYHRIGNSQNAALSNYISLYYDEKGKPFRGRAEVWNEGKPVSTPFFWSRSRSEISNEEVNRWEKYESRVYDIARGSLTLLALNESSF